jgi:hypothetical protein
MSDEDISPRPGRRRWARTDRPDPEQAERNRQDVRDRHRREYPLTAAALDSIVNAPGLPLETAARDLLRFRARQRSRRSARS